MGAAPPTGQACRPESGRGLGFGERAGFWDGARVSAAEREVLQVGFPRVRQRLSRGGGEDAATQLTGCSQACKRPRQHRTNPGTRGRTSADRSTRATLMLTVPRSIIKSSTEDLTRPTFGNTMK